MSRVLLRGALAVLAGGCGGRTAVDRPTPESVPTTSGPAPTCHVIEFEDVTSDDLAHVVDPYVDAETRVTFAAFDPEGREDALVGVRADARTCPSERDPGAMLVTTTGPEEYLGRTSFPILATFPEPLVPPVAVTVEVLVPIGPVEPATLRLLDERGREVAAASERVQPALWPCPTWWPAASGLVRLRAQAEVSVSAAVLEGPPSYVAWWDHFVFSEGAAPDLDDCHSLDTGIPAERLCPVDGGVADYQCVPKVAGLACNQCDLECLRSGVTAFIEAERACVHLPTQIRCGPNPDETEGCCFVVQAETLITCPPD